MQKYSAIENELKELCPLLLELRSNDAMMQLQGSFESLTDQVMFVIQTQEKEVEQRVLPAASDASYQGCYPVPDQYFSKNTDLILAHVQEQCESASRWYRMPILKYAVAACFLGCLGFAAIKFISKPAVENQQSAQAYLSAQLATVSESEMLSFLQESGTDVNAALVASIDDEAELPNEEDLLLSDDIFNEINLDPIHSEVN